MICVVLPFSFSLIQHDCHLRLLIYFLFIDPDYYASEYFVSKLSRKCEDSLPPQDDSDGNNDIEIDFDGITFDPNDAVVNCLLAAPPSPPTLYDELAPNENMKFISSVSLDYQKPVLVLYPGKGTAEDRRNSGADVIIIFLSECDLYFARNLRTIPHEVTYYQALNMVEANDSYAYVNASADYHKNDFGIFRRRNNPDLFAVASLALQGNPNRPGTKMDWYTHMHHALNKAQRDATRDNQTSTIHTRHNYGVANCSWKKNNDGDKYSIVEECEKDHYDSSSTSTKYFFQQVLDGSQILIDKRFNQQKVTPPFSNAQRSRMYGRPFRSMMNTNFARGETVASFLTRTSKDMQDESIVTEHIDTLNGNAPTYEFTVCIHFQMVQEQYHHDPRAPIFRQVVNMNSRRSIDSLMENSEWGQFLNKLQDYTNRVDTDYAIYVQSIGLHPSSHPCPYLSFQKYEDLVLTRSFDWGVSTNTLFVEPSPEPRPSIINVKQFQWMALAPGPSRDYFESACASVLFEFIVQRKKVEANIETTISLLLNGACVALYYCSFHQFVPIIHELLVEGDTEEKLQQLNDNFPRMYWAMHKKLFPIDPKHLQQLSYETIDGGKRPRQQPSAVDFESEFVHQPEKFQQQVNDLRQFMDSVNNTDSTLNRKEYEDLLTSTTPKIHKIDQFRLSCFVSIIAKLGLIKQERMYVADWRTTAKDVTNGSFAASESCKVPKDRCQEFFWDVAVAAGLPPSEGRGESISCEAYRKKVCYDLFYHGQYLFLLFGDKNVQESYVMKYKSFDSSEWIVVDSLL